MHLIRLPEYTTILKFRHFLEYHDAVEGLFIEVSRHLETCGLMLREGRIADDFLTTALSRVLLC